MGTKEKMNKSSATDGKQPEPPKSDWQQLHERNSIRCFWVGVIVLTLAILFGLLGWVFNWMEKTTDLLLTTGEFTIFGLTLISVGLVYKRKAAKPMARSETSPLLEGEPFYIQEHEVMLKKAAGMVPSIHYFSVNGEKLLELKETTHPLHVLSDLFDLRSFLKRSFAILDRQGEVRLLFTQKAGLNSPIVVKLPSGETIATYKQGMIKAEISVFDTQDTLIGTTKSKDLIGSEFVINDAEQNNLMTFINAGTPSRNRDSFTMSDDLLKLRVPLHEDKLRYMQFIALPAFIKIIFGK
ncbi:hypothetical protein [Paenibacillus turpanensis]|uniref:hypothetical protein n=1 Tax=Paenibacillus turpanensis TaxID=2689078 RepID=UPI001407C946|nr:hypothetical protein [Paenibacillus turpanensis]